MPTRIRARRLAATLALLALSATAACTSADTDAGIPQEAQDILAAYELDGLGPRELVETLEATAVSDRPQGLIASVRPDVVLLADASGAEAEVRLPQEEFYVSIAPYIDRTHDCYFHSLTTCLGEMGGEELTVTITDADGAVVVSETLTTQDNGFFGLWLPHDLDGTIVIEHERGTAQAPIATGPDDPTCISTIRLA